MTSIRIHWFRHGLRLHDNPALLKAIQPDSDQKKIQFLPVFIFDGESAGTKIVGYNRLKFLLESLADLDEKFRKFGGRLYLLRGDPTEIFNRLSKEYKIDAICYEYDCEPIWRNRDKNVENLCKKLNIKCIEEVSHTLWDPKLVIKTNGGIPPLTYQMFLHTVDTIGSPPRPVPDPDWTNVEFIHLSESLAKELCVFENIPTPENFNIYPENVGINAHLKWKGGETQALINLQQRLKVEEDAFEKGFYLPNQLNPDVLGSSTSMSAHLRFGCLSVRKFYWSVHDLLKQVKTYCYTTPGGPHITGQLIWREYFYTMSVNNINYDRMENNEICLNIPWAKPSENMLERWKLGKTGFPLIDAAMRQLLVEGWIHHTLRNVTASFLTRGSLWYSWEWGVQHFLMYLLDADWSVCAGNWMWVSSSAFEELLDSSKCTCPIALATRLDPNGEYIKRYVPELANLPSQYIHQPWSCPKDVQEKCGCIIGIHYPERMIDLERASKQNGLAMQRLRYTLISKTAPEGRPPPHCRPSNEDEIRQFFWLSEI